MLTGGNPTMPKLSHEAVTRTKPPAKGSVLIFDGGPDRIRGFAIRIFANGVRSFVLVYRINGRQRRITIGQHPTWSVQAARLRAKELRQQVDSGRDPAEEKLEARDAPTVQDLIGRYVRDALPARKLNPKHTRAAHRMLELIAAGLGERRRVVDIHFGDLEALHHRATEAHGPVAANRLLGQASVLFALSLKPMAGETRPWRDAVMGNPCRGIKRNPEQGRERFFSTAELAAISDALAEYTGPAADCVRLLAFTGARPAEAMKARWEEFDEPGHWNKPSSHTKQRKNHRVPLNAAALELIDRLRKQRGKSELVFGLSDISRCWEFVRDRAGLGKTARLYDLRHSFASLGAGGGLSLLIVGKLLGHSQARTTQRYAHLASDVLKEATDRIGAVITGNGNVTPLKRRS
jgi:integrase